MTQIAAPPTPTADPLVPGVLAEPAKAASDPRPATTAKTATWVVVADAKGARIFSLHDPDGAWTLHQDVLPESEDHSQESAGGGPKASKHKGALHGHGENVAKETDERRFAHRLNQQLAQGLTAQAFAHFAVAAPPKLLGMIRENLSKGLHAALIASVDKDYTHCGVEELITLLRPALTAPSK